MYTSTTTLMPPDSASTNSSYLSLMSSSGAAAAAGSALLGVKTPGSTFIGIMKSRTVEEKLVNRFGLISQYKSKLIEDASKQLAANTQMEEDSKSGIITISVEDRNPVLASKIAQGYVEELDRVVALDSTSSARRERIFLEGRLKEIKQDLDDSSEALSQFSTKSRTIDMPSQASAMMGTGLKLQEELATARSDLAGMRQTYSEDNVRVRTASAQVDELQRQMDKITGLSQKGDSRIDTRESDYPSLEALPALGLTYADMNRKVLVEDALWEALTKQYEAAKVQEAKEIPTVRVLDAANVPQRKSYPVRRDIVFLGAVLSLFAACILVLILSYWEEMDAQDERKQLMREIVITTANSLAWIQRLPGMRWVSRG
jgi:capsule polysaccharide export protein KpsE/RkpR